MGKIKLQCSVRASEHSQRQWAGGSFKVSRIDILEEQLQLCSVSRGKRAGRREKVAVDLEGHS